MDLSLRILQFLVALIAALSSKSISVTASRHSIYQRDTSATISQEAKHGEPEDYHGERSKRQSEAEDGEDNGIIPKDYNPHVAPPLNRTGPRIIEVAFTIINIRDFNEKDEDYNMELNFQMFWEDTRLKNTKPLEGSAFTTINSKLIDKLWTPDIIIDNVKAISQPTLVSKPFSLRVYNDSIVRYSGRLTFKMACPMNFKYYPADTQKCEICLRSLDFDASGIDLRWHPERRAVKIGNDITVLSNYDIKVVNFFTIKDRPRKNGTQFWTVRFEILFKRHLTYHMIQTFLPSIVFVVTSWLSFLVPVETVSARMTLCMSTLLTLTTMFAVVRQNTPNESYAKALDVWMLACIFFVFTTLVEYAFLLKLNSIKVETKKSDDNEESSYSLLCWKNLNWLRHKGPSENNIHAIRNSGVSDGKEIPRNQTRRQVRNPNYPTMSSMVRYDFDQAESCVSGSATVPGSTVPAPETVKHVRIQDPEKYKKLALTLEQVCSYAIPAAFILFNFIFWPTMLILSEHFTNPFPKDGDWLTQKQ